MFETTVPPAHFVESVDCWLCGASFFPPQTHVLYTKYVSFFFFGGGGMILTQLCCVATPKVTSSTKLLLFSHMCYFHVHVESCRVLYLSIHMRFMHTVNTMGASTIRSRRSAWRLPERRRRCWRPSASSRRSKAPEPIRPRSSPPRPSWRARPRTRCGEAF